MMCLIKKILAQNLVWQVKLAYVARQGAIVKPIAPPLALKAKNKSK
jgi:hypothetical protein